jgi:rhodanese-related sulfurtransferase
MSWWTRPFGGGRGAAEGAAHPKKKVKPLVAAQLQREGAVLLDVREQSEWSAGRAPKARHIPLAQLGSRISREVPATATVLTICRSGGRSSQAAATLRRQGYTVVDVAGGMRAWQAAGLPVVASGGRPGRVI